MISLTVTSTSKLTVALRLKRTTITIWCLLIAIASVPNPVANQQRQHQHQQQYQQWPHQQPLLSDRDHYQLIGGDDEAAAASPSFSLADPNDAGVSSLALAELLNSFGGAHQLSGAQQQTRGGGAPGHYEFEVAPKMEPPSAPRPPFKQASVSCPGSDLFGGFSPRHTLCGDLYQGRVPLNPMGQFVNDQAYPFELIKNKTLQFLAKSLPILKDEYETIPKVARYLPAHLMLNPTAHVSPLGHEHFQALNERAGYTSAPPAPFMQQQQRRRRRRRRSTQEISGSGGGRNQHQASITVAELMPNATLVVSSAHSAASLAGRIGGTTGSSHHHHHHQLARSAPETSGHFAMITKDGYRPFATATRVRDTTTMNYTEEQVANTQQRPPQATGGQQQSSSLANTKDNAQQQYSRSHASSAAAQISSGGQQVTQAANVGRSASDDGGQTNSLAAASTTYSRHASQGSLAETAAAHDRQTQDVVQGRSASGGLETGGGGKQDSSTSAGSGGQRASPGQARQQNNGPAVSSPSQQQQPQHLKCANVNGLLMYSVCQAASALIEGDSAPAWLQAAKQIGNLVAATSSADSYSSSTAQASNPLWALWSAFSTTSGGAPGQSSDLAYKSSGSNLHQSKSVVSPASSVASVISLLNPFMSFFAPSLQRASTGDHHSQSIAAGPKTARGNQTSSNQRNNQAATGSGGLSSNLKTISNLLLTGLSIAGLYDWLGTTPLFSPTTTTFARRKKPFDAGETFVDTPASLAALSAAKQLTPGATSGGGSPKQPPTPCPSVEEYISPTFARNYQGQWKYVVQIPHEAYFTQTIQRSSCVRQKCEFTEGVCHEAPRWVSLLVAEIYYPNVVFNSPSQQVGQSSAGANQHTLDVLNQRVALDNNMPATTPMSANAQLMSQLAMSMAPSNSHLQQTVALGQQNQHHQAKSLSPNSQDPLQMTDSLNTYNHNLINNAAFFNVANELGLDPTNVVQMQQLAQAHNFQLSQRNGLVPLPAHQAHSHQQQQPVTAESRVSISSGGGGGGDNYQPAAAAIKQQRPQQVQQHPQQYDAQQQQPVFTNDYIKALALETIRQNPHLSIDDLIKSLQMPQAAARRKKRNLSAQIDQQPHPQTMHHFNQSPVSQVPQLQQQQQQHLATRRSSGSQPAQFVAPASAQTGGAGGEQMMPQMNELSSTQAAQLAAVQQLDPAAGQLSGQSSMGRQQQQQQQAVAMINNNQQQHNMIRTPAVETHDHLFKQQTSTTPANQMIASQSTLMNDIGATVSQQQNANDAATTGPGQQHSTNAADSQAECDGHDKIGCYVVRVYYDWFLVNGSCKCWKTNNPSQPQGSSSNTGGSSSGGFIRRIFTG